MKLADFAILSCGVLLNALAQLGLKTATQVTGPLVVADGSLWRRGLDLMAVPSLWYAVGAYGLSLIVWLVGLSRVPVSQDTYSDAEMTSMARGVASSVANTLAASPAAPHCPGTPGC